MPARTSPGWAIRACARRSGNGRPRTGPPTPPQQQSVETSALHTGLQSLEMPHETYFRGAPTAKHAAKRSIIDMILAARPTDVKRAHRVPVATEERAAPPGAEARRRGGATESSGGGGPERRAPQLARRTPREQFSELEGLRDLVRREPLAAVHPQVVGRRRRPTASLDDCVDPATPFGVGHCRRRRSRRRHYVRTAPPRPRPGRHWPRP